MKPYWTNGRVVLWQGHVLDCLAAMEAGSVHCAVTSPPYWGLRDYDLPSLEWPAVSYAPMAGLPPVEIPGCDPGCEHVWGDGPSMSVGRNDESPQELQRRYEAGYRFAPSSKTTDNNPRTATAGQYCQLCGGWRGCLGLEPTVEMFVGHIVLIWRELWRVMRDDATCWLNFGDSYSGSWGNYAPGGIKNEQRPQTENGARYKRPAYSSTTFKPPTANVGNLKPKDLMGVPWRVAFALQADGWYLRSDIIWAKGVSFCPTYSGSCMPESVRDRPTKGHEYVFLWSKGKKYFYDGDAVREGFVDERMGNPGKYNRGLSAEQFPGVDRLTGGMAPGAEMKSNPAGRNLRTVWTINPGSYAGAHFATFPPKLVEPMIKAGTSAKGCCPECGSPWVRVTERKQGDNQEWAQDANPSDKETALIEAGGRCGHGKLNRGSKADYYANAARNITTSWRPTCSCGTEHPIPQEELDADPSLLDDFEIEPFEPVPCTVLDPFFGSGTTGQVALKLGRKVEGIELSKSYCDDHIIPRLSKGIQMELL